MEDVLKLTNDEESLLNEKIKAIKEFERLFPNSALLKDVYFWAKNFSFKDFFQDSFIETIKPIIKYNLENNETNEDVSFELVNAYIAYGVDNDEFPSNEARLYFINKIENYISELISKGKRHMHLTNLFKLYKDLINAVYPGDSSFIYFIKSRYTKSVYSYKSFFDIENIINKYLLEAPITDIDGVIDAVTASYKYYANFPLIILNKNISKEVKIKAIKKTYRKSDMPKYKKFFSANMNDWMDIDLFIEATVTQNGRIKDKEVSYVQFFKDIFVPGFENIRGLNVSHYKEMKNSEYFRKKYSFLFHDWMFLREFIYEASECYKNSHRSNYDHRQTETRDLIAFMLMDLPTEKLCRINMELPILRDYSGVDYARLYRDECAKKNKEGEEVLRNMFISWYMTNEINIEKYANYIFNDYSAYYRNELLLKHIKSNDDKIMSVLQKKPFIAFSENKKTPILTVMSYKTDSDRRWRDEETIKDIITSLSDEAILTHNYMGRLFLDFGFSHNLEDVRGSDYVSYSIVSAYNNLETYQTHLLYAAKNTLILTPEIREKAISEYLEFYQDAEILQSLFDAVMVLNNFNFGTSYKKSTRDTLTMAIDYLTLRKELAELLFPEERKEEKDKLVDEINGVLNNLSLISSI